MAAKSAAASPVRFEPKPVAGFEQRRINASSVRAHVWPSAASDPGNAPLQADGTGGSVRPRRVARSHRPAEALHSFVSGKLFTIQHLLNVGCAHHEGIPRHRENRKAAVRWCDIRGQVELQTAACKVRQDLPHPAARRPRDLEDGLISVIVQGNVGPPILHRDAMMSRCLVALGVAVHSNQGLALNLPLNNSSPRPPVKGNREVHAAGNEVQRKASPAALGTSVCGGRPPI